ncbi:MAG: hydantoinase/oxoprolinase family protein [Bacillota bacterium]|jgi:N-methylhydantoinase A/oxoprolinase/acetone carboxylase beta subunit
MARVIGIDVGGTNTHAALLQDGKLIATARCPTDQQDLLVGAAAVLEELLAALPRATPEDLELHLSTTLTTNAIVAGRHEPTAAVIVPGPGVNPAELKFPFPTYVIGGAVDHRGRETAPLDRAALRQALAAIRKSGVAAVALVGKFSVRNPRHELEMAELVQQEFSEIKGITLGHRLSGRLNFPRRVITAVLNAGVSRLQADFAVMVRQLAERRGIGERIFLLKADGGTMPLAESLVRPVETVLSGPAASIMGALAWGAPRQKVAVSLDIGGTTTEIAVLLDGEPLGERDGAVVAGYRTLIPALFTRSVGLGGDSRITWRDGELHIGPERAGPPAALAGPTLTPTDAVIALTDTGLGNRDLAWAELQRFGQSGGWGGEELAREIVATFCTRLAAEIQAVFTALNRRPVYTVAEVLAPADLKPEKLIGMGGPAAYFIPKLAAQMGLDFETLPYAAAANAVGAAASRPTVAVNLRADTALGTLAVPELDELGPLPRPRLFDVRQARELIRAKTVDYAARAGVGVGTAQVEITEEEIFNVVRGFYTTGRIYTLQAQVKPEVQRVTTSNASTKESNDG